jgi:hypothetical protein
MPSFYVEDIDIDPDEYVSSCDSKDIDELIVELEDELEERGYIKPNQGVKNTPPSANEIRFLEAVQKIKLNYLNLTLEEEAYIIELANRI